MKSHVCGTPDINCDDFIDRKQGRFMGINAKYAFIAMHTHPTRTTDMCVGGRKGEGCEVPSRLSRAEMGDVYATEELPIYTHRFCKTAAHSTIPTHTAAKVGHPCHSLQRDSGRGSGRSSGLVRGCGQPTTVASVRRQRRRWPCRRTCTVGVRYSGALYIASAREARGACSTHTPISECAVRRARASLSPSSQSAASPRQQLDFQVQTRWRKTCARRDRIGDMCARRRCECGGRV